MFINVYHIVYHNLIAEKMAGKIKTRPNRIFNNLKETNSLKIFSNQTTYDNLNSNIINVVLEHIHFKRIRRENILIIKNTNIQQ